MLGYACVPMLDGRGMSAGAFDRAMVQVQAWREAGHDVLIHCAYGHGRSVSVACALLVAEGTDVDSCGKGADPESATPRRVRSYQRPVVEDWLAQHTHR